MRQFIIGQALIKDHPEYFGFYWSTDWNYQFYSNPNSEGKYQIECKINSPYKEYESEVTKFNEAVFAFLSGIDRTRRPEQIALEIHDKLMDTVEYDYDALENGNDEYVYTAYGVLVENKKGQKNMAVCEGYSMAYEYLCQLSGLEVTVIHGDAGSSMDDLGPHAWNAVKLDEDWYEVDSTWDDCSGASVRTIEGEGDAKEVTDQINADDVFCNKVSHIYFLLTTDEMTHRAPEENTCTYYSDTLIYYLCGDEDYHFRSGTDDDGTADLMPTAEGTFYSYDTITAE